MYICAVIWENYKRKEIHYWQRQLHTSALHPLFTAILTLSARFPCRLYLIHILLSSSYSFQALYFILPSTPLPLPLVDHPLLTFPVPCSLHLSIIPILHLSPLYSNARVRTKILQEGGRQQTIHLNQARQ